MRRWVLQWAAALLLADPAAFAQSHPAAHHSVPSGQLQAEQLPVAQEEAGEAGGDYQQYLAFKEGLQSRYGIQYSFALSLLPQWTGARGAGGIANFVYTPWVSWTPFEDTSAGSGSFVVSFQQNRFIGGRDGYQHYARAGLLAPASDWLTNIADLDQLSYTHTFPGAWRWLSLTVGQYSFGIFDRNDLAGDAQIGFVNYALTQNATQTFPSSELGGYVQAAAPDEEWVLAAGVEGGTNLNGTGFSTRGLRTGRLAWFTAVQAAPHWLGGTYRLLWYEQPAVPAQPSRSQGMSFNAVQPIGANWSAFLRINHASGIASPIETSLASGIVIVGPFPPRPRDRLGVGVAWNETNLRAVGEPARPSEVVTELYYNCAVWWGLTIGPDIQVYANPALAPRSDPAVELTLRVTAIF
jgi:hypothetical protein